MFEKFKYHLTQIIKNTVKNASKTILFILKIIIPVTFFVKLLQYLNVLTYITLVFEPLMKFIGLPGEAALVLVTANLINIYGGLAVMASLTFTMKEVTILAVMILFSHSLIIECSVIKGLKVPVFKQLFIRISAAILSGIVLNLLIGQNYQTIATTTTKNLSEIPHISDFTNWLKALIIDYGVSIYQTGLDIIIIITLVLLSLEILKELKILNHLNNIIYHLTKFFGLSKSANLSLLVGLFIGITYGAGTILVQYKEGNLNKTDVLLVTTFLMLCHSIFEDVILFVRQGAVLWILLLYKLSFTLIVVFFYNLYLKRKAKLSN